MTTPPPLPEQPTPPPAPSTAGVGIGAGIPTKTQGLAIAALIVGIAAFLFGLIPVFGALVGATAVILGIVALRKAQPKGLAITGIVLGALATITSIGTTAGMGALVNSAQTGHLTETVQSSSPSPSATAKPTPSATSTPVAAKPSATPTVQAAPAVPAEFTSALKKAKTYSDIMHMSKAGLYDQLTSEYGEQFSPEAAQYAIDNVHADWNANALAKARTYQESMAMSPSAIHDQLTSEYGEKFTQEEADYAIANLNG